MGLDVCNDNLTFESVADGIYLLKSPFGKLWSGIVLVKGTENFLIDSGADSAVIDDCLVTALQEAGVGHIDYLLITHCHGDHIGGCKRIKDLFDSKIITFAGSAKKLENPALYAAIIRAKFPKYSPPTRSDLYGVRADATLSDGEILGDRLKLIHTPGHDDDCVCWLDLQTNTLITGDSVQANGTPAQGIGFYQDLPAYRASLERLISIGADHLLAGHEYSGLGYLVKGREKVETALRESLRYVERYKEYITKCVNQGITNPADIARKMTREIGCGVPDKLFMALYTVTQHMEGLN